MDNPFAAPVMTRTTLARLVPYSDSAATPSAAPACHGEDPDLWFSDRPGDVDRAVQACRRCPLLRKCLRYALVHGQNSGVWGGMPEEQRAALRAELLDRTGDEDLDGTRELEAALDQHTLALGQEQVAAVSA
ncbi:WhiB family transcriptional regulator [Amycolatopsis methanolica]|uniref:WhiB family transcriptional regulator n=1 Tax=Amycolatopsis methanolica TaxID=1814 RepID=UPI0034202DA2